MARAARTFHMAVIRMLARFHPWLRVVAIVRRLAVSTPVAFVCPGRRVEDNDAVVHVAVCDIQFIGRLIDNHTCRSAQIFSIVAALVLPRMPNLEQELALICKFQKLIVILSSSTHPHVIVQIDVDSMYFPGPVITGRRTAPRCKHGAVGGEFENRWRSVMFRVTSCGPLHDPYVPRGDPERRRRLGLKPSY